MYDVRRVYNLSILNTIYYIPYTTYHIPNTTYHIPNLNPMRFEWLRRDPF